MYLKRLMTDLACTLQLAVRHSRQSPEREKCYTENLY